MMQINVFARLRQYATLSALVVLPLKHLVSAANVFRVQRLVWYVHPNTPEAPGRMGYFARLPLGPVFPV